MTRDVPTIQQQTSEHLKDVTLPQSGGHGGEEHRSLRDHYRVWGSGAHEQPSLQRLTAIRRRGPIGE